MWISTTEQKHLNSISAQVHWPRTKRTPWSLLKIEVMWYENIFFSVGFERRCHGQIFIWAIEVEQPRYSETSLREWWLSDCQCSLFTSASKSSIRRFVITEKAPTRAFSWLNAATTAFTFKTLLRHYAKRTLTPRSLNVKLGPRRNYHKGGYKTLC